ncbi:MAG: hypothetical protein HUU35_19720, partial [Armatimonadetes bacterium]|nr:hypothetical protein [Armatimonadota bacterium]
MALLALGLVSLLAGGVSQEIAFQGGRLPAEQRLPWVGRAAPETSLAADGEALRVTDNGTAQGQLLLVSYPWGADPEQPHRLEAEVKVLRASGPAGVVLLAANGAREAGLSLYPERVELHRHNLDAPVRLDDRFHRVTLIMQQDNMVVQVDGQTLLDLTGRWSQPAHEGRNLVGFGSLSSPATGEALWRSVRATLDFPAVALLPGAEQVVVYRQEGVYACFPSLYPLGDLLVASFGTRARRSHLDPTGGSARMLSRDGGRTWQPAPPDLRVAAPW